VFSSSGGGQFHRGGDLIGGEQEEKGRRTVGRGTS